MTYSVAYYTINRQTGVTTSVLRLLDHHRCQPGGDLTSGCGDQEYREREKILEPQIVGRNTDECVSRVVR